MFGLMSAVLRLNVLVNFVLGCFERVLVLFCICCCLAVVLVVNRDFSEDRVCESEAFRASSHSQRDGYSVGSDQDV